MPVRRGKDSKGPYYSWGHLKKYRYKAGDSSSRTRARNLAAKQGRAVEWRKHGGVEEKERKTQNEKRYVGVFMLC
jgi:hypothetical protein